MKTNGRHTDLVQHIDIDHVQHTTINALGNHSSNDLVVKVDLGQGGQPMAHLLGTPPLYMLPIWDVPLSLGSNLRRGCGCTVLVCHAR